MLALSTLSVRSGGGAMSGGVARSLPGLPAPPSLATGLGWQVL